MDDTMYRVLTRITAVLLVASIAWIAYAGFSGTGRGPGGMAVLAGDRAFADGKHKRALREYDTALTEAPEHLDAIRGKARTLLQLGRYDEALAYFDLAIEMDPGFPGTYANRAITYDRMGNHEQALRNYELALALNPTVAEGPGWVTRLLHMDAKGPPTIADRAAYLRMQLALPAEERILLNPEEDDSQRTYSKRLKKSVADSQLSSGR